MKRRLGAASVTIVLAACSHRETASLPTSPSANETPASNATGCARTSIGVQPLTELRDAYMGEAGGLYPNGVNTVPSGHLAAGVAAAQSIAPLDRDGNSTANGRYVFMSIGMSNTTQEFSTFKPLADADPVKRPALVIVDAAQGGVTASQWASPSCACWSTADQRLTTAGVTPAQVVAAWVKLANAAPTEPYPIHAQRLRDDIIATLRNAKQRYPNLRVAYLSSRIYSGYATSNLNPEPYAYESGFAVRDVIAAQLRGDASLNFDSARGRVEAPWLAWGPYLWADGLRARGDGLTWNCSDFGSDGTHPSNSGRRKVADALLAFVESDTTARIWFTR